MKEKRKVYPAEFKRQAVQLARQPQRTVEDVAEELGISKSSVSRWIGEYGGKGEQAFPGQGKVVLTPEQAEVGRLKRELELARQERDILKRALACLGQNGTPWGLPASLPRSRGEVAVHPDSPTALERGVDVWSAGGISQWLLRMGRSALRHSGRAATRARKARIQA